MGAVDLVDALSRRPACCCRPGCLILAGSATYRPSLCVGHQRAERRYRPRGRQHSLCRAEGRSKADDDKQLQERLRTAESEAAQLREQLEAARRGNGNTASSSGSQQQPPSETKRKSRIDAGDLKRESLFSSRTADWLDESGISAAFRAKGPVEAVSQATNTEGDVVRKRLLISIFITAAAVGLALIPSDQFRMFKPSKPLYVYLLPLVRAQALLPYLEDIVGNGNWEELPAALRSIQSSPTNIEQNLKDATAALTDSRRTDKAISITRGIMEDLEAVDYTKYFSTVKKRGANTGAEQKQFSEFSARAVRAVKDKLRDFLALMPAEDIRQARELANESE